MDRDEAEKKAQQLYEKISDWKESLPEDLQHGVDVIKSSGTRVEVIKSADGALEVTVVAPDQFSVRVPRIDPKIMAEKEMWKTVRQWLLVPSDRTT
jgi:hypothetical protein